MAKLPELCSIQYGYAFDSAYFTEDHAYPPLVRIRDVKRGYSETFYSGHYPSDYVIDNGSLLGGTDGGFNIARWKGGKALLNQRVCKITAKENVSEEYIRFTLSRALKEIENRTAFVTVKHLSAKELNQLEIYIPVFDTQVERSETLLRIENIISIRQQQLQKLDELVKARFVEMFGEPLINTKGWGTRPIVEVAPIKPLHGNLSDTVWLLNLDAIESQTGNVLFKQRVRSAEINASTVYFTTENILYSKLRPYLNKVVMPDEDGIATSELIPMCPQADKLDRTYLCYWLRSDAFVKHISEKVAGAKMPRVSMDYFRTMSIELPPIKLQEQFASFVEQADRSKAVVQKSLDKAQLLFDSLMQEFFG